MESTITLDGYLMSKTACYFLIYMHFIESITSFLSYFNMTFDSENRDRFEPKEKHDVFCFDFYIFYILFYVIGVFYCLCDFLFMTCRHQETGLL